MGSPGLRRLLEKYINNSISEEEFIELWKTLDQRRFDPDWLKAIEEVHDNPELHGLADEAQAAGRLARIKAMIGNAEGMQRGFPLPGSRRPVIRMAGYAAAAVVLLVSGIYLFHRSSAGRPPAVAEASVTGGKIQPGSQRAILTLSDGRTVTLDSAANGPIAQQGATQVLKLANGQVRYQPSSGHDDKIAYNVLSTPMGGQYRLTLPDGTNVWLNAGSSITYPTAFPGNERKVVITGEVYFEVAKDKSKAFRVSAGEQQIEVLGTHFNINAYANEAHVKTSLLEGAIKVNKVLLRPGQAFADNQIAPTNIEQDIAWKNGIFNFNNQSLEQVMRQLARWYDLDIVYPNGIPQKEFGGEMGRNLSLGQVLKGLENSNIHFELSGKRLTVR